MATPRRFHATQAIGFKPFARYSDRLLGSGPLLLLHVDVQDPESVELMVRAVIARHGRLDCIVNSAGIGSDIPFLQTSLETFDRIVAVNLRGTFIVGQAAARTMKETGGGSIVNIASVSGITGNAGRSAYGASKWGVVGLSRVMAIDLAAFGPLTHRCTATHAQRKWLALSCSFVRAMPALLQGMSWWSTADFQPRDSLWRPAATTEPQCCALGARSKLQPAESATARPQPGLLPGLRAATQAVRYRDRTSQSADRNACA